MTLPPPQREYIITEFQLEQLQDFASLEFVCQAIRSRPHAPAPKSGCDGCRKETEHLECPMPGKCDQMKCPICCEGSDFPTLPQEIAKYEAEAARAATLACRDIVYNKVTYNKCPFDGDCGQCFLCDNAGGCIVTSDEEIRGMFNASARVQP
jgi:hypothetical protein